MTVRENDGVADGRVGHDARRTAGFDWVAEVRTALMVAHRELLRFVRAPGRLLSSFVLPLTFLAVFGLGLNRLVGSNGNVEFVQFILPGVVAMIVLMSGIGSCVLVIWDREFGFLREMLVAPPHRVSLVIGRMAGGTAIASMQGIAILLLTPILGVKLELLTVVATIAIVILIAVAGTAAGMFLASWIKRMESFSAIMPLVMMPTMFLSGAFFPIQTLPGWLAVVVHLNPLTYGVDLLRRVVLSAQVSAADSHGPFTSGVALFGYELPILVEVGFVVALIVVFVALTARRFGKPT
ncbi:MAG: ABC transporter [Actinophytocola sp.]|nr:ABC transporter [Actinophytocola sp.]